MKVVGFIHISNFYDHALPYISKASSVYDQKMFLIMVDEKNT